jgi:nucleoside-diphosphate-sugar epimerase
MTLAFVTGAPGWLGTRLVECLVKGHPDLDHPGFTGGPVRCLVKPGSDLTPLRALGNAVEVREGDLRNPGDVQAFLSGGEGGTLYHCAGVIHPAGGIRELYQVNSEGTSQLLAAASSSGLRRFIYMSSNSPIGTNRRPEDQFDEDAPYHPYMHYGRSKMQAERAVLAAGRAGRLQTVVVRSPWFYGPNQPARQSLFFRMIREGKFPLVGTGENRRSMAYIDNICQGLILCQRVDRAAGRTYWIADRRPYSMNEILATVEEVMEKDFGVSPARKRLRLPGLVGDVAQLADAAIQWTGRYNQKIHVLSEMNKTIACTIARAESELGYRPQVELREGMRRSLAWMRTQGMSW